MFVERKLLDFKSWNAPHWLKVRFILYTAARPLLSIFLHLPILKRSCRDSSTDKSFNFEGESIKVFGYQARLRTFKYPGLSLTNLQFRDARLPFSHSVALKIAIRNSFRQTVLLHCKFGNLRLAPDWKFRERGSGAALHLNDKIFQIAKRDIQLMQNKFKW